MLDPDRSDRSLLLRLKEEMSHRIPAPLHSGFLPPAPHGVLKSLLENPVKLPQHDAFSKDQDKEKKLEEERSAPQSAFLGPTLWDKTLPYDGDTFQLEYMDLEEFLSENGIPSSPSQQHHDQHRHNQRQPPIMVPPTPAPPTVVDLRNHASTSAHTTVVPSNARAGLLSSRNTPSPIDPDSIQVPVGYDPDPADLALSSVPGQEMFDPRRRKFSADELKPQPMIKKARKVFIPEDMKVSWRRFGSEPGFSWRRFGSEPGFRWRRFGSEPGFSFRRFGSEPGFRWRRFG
ncbi:HLF transcription factor, PAR bZIP family member b isoform X4 [Acanthochromis polyacanthus]|uniref:HLF transcription factor, PAR bZIP family member b isoform X4 n=1 Tax=Acanthochromis polyacanthus TaxID=80966 RepID=UPI00223400BC|nr:HLF transcription factor, PAR bZIP family member b isoform X4 [Acanthochromis polyacanthus]